MKKLIIWDFDGVIADTERLLLINRTDMINHKFGLNWDFRTTINLLAGMSDKTKRQVLDDMGLKTEDSFWEEATARDMQTIGKGFALTPDIEKILQLKDFYQCIATGGMAQKTKKKIEAVGIRKYFPEQKVFTVDMVAKGKPEPDLYLLAAKNMGYKPQDCTVIEDSIAGMTAGIRAGMNVVAFLGNNLYEDDFMKERIKAIGVKHIFYNMKDVLKYLKEEK